MAQGRVNRNVKPPTEKAEASIVQPETFLFTMPNGDILLVGKPLSVLKLKLRKLLEDEDDRKDPEMVSLAKAFLCIRSVNGFPEPVSNPQQFQAMVSRFGTDENLERFQYEFARLMQPEVLEAVERARLEAIDKKIPAKDVQQFIEDRVAEFQEEERRNVLD